MELAMMSIFSNALDTVLIYYFLIKISGKKVINIRKTSLYLMGLILLDASVNIIFGLENPIGFLIILVISTWVYSLLLDEAFMNLLIYSILATILMGIIEIISIFIISISYNLLPEFVLKVNVYRFMAIILSKLTLYLIIRYLVYKIDLLGYTNIKLNKFVVPIVFYYLLIIFMSHNIYMNIEEGLVTAYVYLASVGLGTIIFSWLIYGISRELISHKEQEGIWKIKEEEFYKKNFYIDNMKEVLDTIKGQSHELNNYLSTLYGLIYLENYEDAKDYIRKINDRIINMNTIIETNNPIITALISMKKNRVFKDGIHMDMEVSLPESLPFDSLDLSIIINNLLNNAIEACLLLEKENRKIEFSMGFNEENLYINIVNSKSSLNKVDTKKIIGRYTSKLDKENHGFGLSNIDFLVRQYKGDFCLEDLGDKFKVDITLPINMDVEDNIEFTI